MATKQIGKLKLHWSKRGVAFKWGDGEIHRLSFERKKPDGAQDYEGQVYGQDQYDGQEGYQGQPYDGQGYDGQEDYYGAPPREGGRYDFLYSNDYLMYALLVLLPPLGIWILWKRERFTPTIRGIVTAASGIWFVLLLVWLFTAMLSTGTDSIRTQSPSATPPAASMATAAPQVQGGTTDVVVAATPAPTPLTAVGSNTTDLTGSTGSTGTTGSTGAATTTGTSATDAATVSASDYCYYTSTGQYFHANNDCPELGENAIQATVAIARSRGLKECPSCYGTSAATDAAGTSTSGTVIYATKKGRYYHVNQTCSNMKNAQVYTLNQAKKEGKKPCPTCIGQYYCTDGGKYYHLTKTCSGMENAHLTTAKAAEAAGKVKCPECLEKYAKKKSTTTSSATYYSTAKGKYYHVNKTCSSMKGAQKVTQAVIKRRGQTACPVCIGTKAKSTASNSSGKYYATRNGTYYHTKSDCSGMKGATQITLATAKKYGKKACPECVATASSASTATYYATSAGKYYHKNSTCSGMKGAKKVTKAAAEKNGKTACPVCLKDMATYVYATSGGKYYHKTSTCSGMKDAKRVTLAAAKKNGKSACPTCYKAQVAKEAVYYATSAGKYYHVKANCSGMKNATKVTLATATARGKTPCPVCLGKSTTYYYATKAGKYYHTKSGCSGMKNASKVTLKAAQNAGKLPCPVCVAKKAAAAATPAPTAANKVYCYASTGSKYYHKNQGCSGLTNLKKVLLSTAKNRGKTACPVCVTKTVKASNLTTNYADKQTICYASNASAYYHGDKNCVSGLSKTTVKAAKAKGKTACPTCAKNMNTYVYVTRSGTKYHRKNTCSGTVNAYKISLNTAIKLNYVRCTKCNAPKKN